MKGKAKNDLFGARELSFIVVALSISFKLTERISLSGRRTVAVTLGVTNIKVFVPINWKLLLPLARVRFVIIC